MGWEGNKGASLTARVSALVPNLQKTELKVIDFVMADKSNAIELTAQGLADKVGVSRASVVRTAQTLGYDGFPQLRVALAQELATSSDDPEPDGALHATIDRYRTSLDNFSSLVDEAAVGRVVDKIAAADRVLVAGNGFSYPLALDAAQRLSSIGIAADMPPDVMTQQIVAGRLSKQSVCLVYSGSGANALTLDVAKAARESGAEVVAVTSFSNSALADIATDTVVVPVANESFRSELTVTSRAGVMILTEALVAMLSNGRALRLAAMEQAGQSLRE